MRTHTQAFKDGIKQYGRQFTDTLYYNSSTYTGEHINSVNYSVDTTLMKSVMQTIKIDTDIVMNIGDTLDYGISIDGVTGSEIRFNNFNIIKKEEQKDKKSYLYTCQDNMIKAMQDYVSFYSATLDVTFVDGKNYYQLVDGKYVRYTGDRTGNPFNLGLKQSAFPMTIRTYISNICTALRLTFKNASDTFTNYNQNVTEEHYVDIDNNSMGYTFRDVLDDIAEAVGGFICIDSLGQLEIRYSTQAVGTKNLFNKNTITTGKYINNTGTLGSSGNYNASDYIVVNGLEKVTYSGNTDIRPNYASKVAFYNSSKSFISYGDISLGSSTYTIPNNAYYMRITMRNTDTNKIQVEKGSQATDYEPYYDTINEDYFSDKNVNIGKQITYNTLVLSRGDDSDNIYRPSTLPANPVEFKISDNPILEQTNREDFIDGIFNNINGLSFYTNDFATKGILYYEVGDKYNVSIGGNTYSCLMLSDNIKRTQGLVENIVTNEPKQSVTPYKYASTTDKLEIQSRNAYIIADKANGTASMIVEGIGSNGQVTGASVIASINDDTSQVSIDADKININGVVSANNSFEIDTNGNMSCNNANITGGYLSLTDYASDPEDRFIITSEDETKVTTATSEYVITRSLSDNYNYVQSSLATGFSHSKGSSTQWKSGGINGNVLSLTDFRNNTTKEISLDPYNGSIFDSDVTIGGDITASGKLEVGSVLSGTWTPSLSNTNNNNPSVNYSYQQGHYFKLGNLVYIEFYIRGKITALNSGDYACIRGLPYSANSSRSFGAQALSIGILYNAVTVETNNTFIANGWIIRLQAGNGASATIWKTSSSDFIISGSGWYSI